MQPKLIKTTLGTYVPASWSGKNESGWQPIGDRVLVLPDTAAEMTQGGIALPAEIIGRHTMAAEAGIVVAMGDGAFEWNSDKVTKFAGQVPKPGDRVNIERYSGQLIHGYDGQVYRVMDATCISSICIHKEAK